ncbi:MAG: Transglutaminase Domain-Containing Protein [Bacteroidetes bacterium]|nr:Transglutaminase Domain-Containing Protein [Bacteroidota bacterium]
MKKFFIIAIYFFTFVSFICAKNERADLNTSVISETLSKDANAIIRNNEIFFEYISPERGILTEKMEITILNEKGKEHGNFSYPGDKYRTLSDFSGAVYDSQGNLIRKLKKSEIVSSEWSQYLASGDVHYFMNIDPVMYPYTVVYEYAVEYKNGILTFPAFAPQSSPDIAVIKSKYELRVPENTEIDIKVFNAEKLQKAKNEKSIDFYIAEINNRAAIQEETLMPDQSNYIPLILARPVKFIYDKVPGQITDWNSLGSWQYNLWKDRDLLDEPTKQKIKDLTAGTTSDREKIKILYDYLGENTHYQNISLGIGGYQPMLASEVCRIGFGDCKGLTNYLHAMLKVIGIKSNITTIKSSESSKSIFTDYANFTQLNHVILQVPLPDDTLWLESTNTEIPFGFVHNEIAGHHALVLSEKESKICTLPDYPDSLSIDKNVSNISVSADGKATGKTTNFSFAKVYDDFCYIAKEKYSDQLDKMRSMIKLPNADVFGISMKETKSSLPCLAVDMSWNSSMYGTKTGTRLFLPANPLRSGEYNLKKKERKFDIEILDGFRDVDSLHLTIPENFVVEAMPAPVNIKSPFGDFSSSIVAKENNLLIVQNLNISRGYWKASVYPDLLAFFEKVNSTYKGKIIIKPKE